MVTVHTPLDDAVQPPDALANTKAAAILRAARRVFLDHGFGAATTDTIQREAGVSKSTVYAHFPTKDDLFAAVIQAECCGFMQGVVAEPAEETGLRAGLRQVAVGFLDLILDPAALAFYRIVVAEAGRFPRLGEAFYRSGPWRLQARVADLLRRGAASGEIHLDDPDGAAEFFIGMLRGDRHLRCLLGLEAKPALPELRRIADHVVDTFLLPYRATDWGRR